MLFSATLAGEVGELAQAYTRDPQTFESRREVENDDGVIEHDFVAVTHDGKIDTLIELLGSEDGLSLVFVRTKRGADRLAQKLAKPGVEGVAMHAALGPAPRARALARFRSR